MYLVQMYLNDDSIPQAGSFNKTIKVEKLQGFNIQQLKRSPKQKPQWCYAVEFIPVKGGSFEQHLHYHDSHESLECGDLIAMGIYDSEFDALSVVDEFERYNGTQSDINDSIAFNRGHFLFKSFDV